MRARSAAWAAAAVLLLTSCTSGLPGGGEETPEASTSGLATAEAAGAPAPEIAGAVPGGTLTVLSPDVPMTLDPSSAREPATMALLTGLLTRTLTSYRWDPESGTAELVPDLATDLGRPNGDQTAWTFTVRDGVRYEDGRPVTAGDVARAVRRSAVAPQIQGVSVDGDDVTLRLRRSFPDLPSYVALPMFTGVPRETGRPSGTPLATGPYRVDSWREHTLVLARNEEWDAGTDPVRRAYPDRWVVRFGLDADQLDELLVVDGPDHEHGLALASVRARALLVAQRAGLLDGDDARVVTAEPACEDTWYVDTGRVRDPVVRQALATAFPGAAVASAAGDVTGTTRAEPDDAPDATEARRLLGSVNAEGTVLRFPFPTDDPYAKAVKDVLVTELREAGFDPRPVLTTRRDLPAMLASGQAGLHLRPGRWCALWPGAPDPRAPGDPQPVSANRWVALPMAEPLVVLLHGSGVRGMAVHPVTGQPMFSAMWADPDEAEE